jgi:hypothetical protein
MILGLALGLVNTATDIAILGNAVNKGVNFFERCRYAASKQRNFNEPFYTEKFAHTITKIRYDSLPDYVQFYVFHEAMNITNRPQGYIFGLGDSDAITCVDDKGVRYKSDGYEYESTPPVREYQPRIPYRLISHIKVSYAFTCPKGKDGIPIVPFYLSADNYVAIKAVK